MRCGSANRGSRRRSSAFRESGIMASQSSPSPSRVSSPVSRGEPSTRSVARTAWSTAPKRAPIAAASSGACSSNACQVATPRSLAGRRAILTGRGQPAQRRRPLRGAGGARAVRTRDEVAAAFRARAKELHPDRAARRRKRRGAVPAGRRRLPDPRRSRAAGPVRRGPPGPYRAVDVGSAGRAGGRSGGGAPRLRSRRAVPGSVSAAAVPAWRWPVEQPSSCWACSPAPSW